MAVGGGHVVLGLAQREVAREGDRGVKAVEGDEDDAGDEGAVIATDWSSPVSRPVTGHQVADATPPTLPVEKASLQH